MERLEEVTHRLRGERAHSSREFCSEHGRVVFRPFREARLRPHVLPFGGSEPLVGLGMHKARSHDESQRERGIPVRWIAYRTGRVTYLGEGLRRMPIIDYRGYVDQPENGGKVHSRFHSFSMRQRLLEANGTFENHIMLAEDGLGPTVVGATAEDDGGVAVLAFPKLPPRATATLSARPGRSRSCAQARRRVAAKPDAIA